MKSDSVNEFTKMHTWSAFPDRRTKSITPLLVWMHWVTMSNVKSTGLSLSLVPRPPCPALSLAVRKAGGRPGRIYHIMRAIVDVTFSLLTSGFVLSPSLFFPWIQFVLSVQFVLWVRLLLDQLWLATVRQQWHTSCDKSVQAFSPLFVLQATKAGRGGLGMRLVIS